MAAEAPVTQEEDRQRPILRCPRCGSEEVHEFRQGVARYHINRDTETFEYIIRRSEDPIFHRCIDCGYGSDSDIWEQEGYSDFVPRDGVTQ